MLGFDQLRGGSKFGRINSREQEIIVGRIEQPEVELNSRF